MINSPAGTAEAIEEACALHLTNGLEDHIQLCLWPDWFLDLKFFHVSDKGSQVDALKTIEKSLRDALRAINGLHLDVDRALEFQVSENLKRDVPLYRFQTFTNYDGEPAPIQTNDNLKLLVRAALAAFLGQAADSHNLEYKHPHRQNSAIQPAKASLSDLNMLDISPKELASETWQKTLMVGRCRQLWEAGTGKPAPNAATGPFGRFLHDMIYAIGKSDDWKSGRATMNAWRDRSKDSNWTLRN